MKPIAPLSVADCVAEMGCWGQGGLTATGACQQGRGTFGFLDLAPLGRNEDPRDPGAWWHRNDEYGSA